jgi:hypothetical protein
MYIFEVLTKIFKEKKYKKLFPYQADYKENIIETPEDCEHFFMPLDSSNEMFACKYCGLVVSKDKLNNKQ